MFVFFFFFFFIFCFFFVFFANQNNLFDAIAVTASFVLKLRRHDIRTRKGSFVVSLTSVTIGFLKWFIACFNNLIIIAIFFIFDFIGIRIMNWFIEISF